MSKYLINGESIEAIADGFRTSRGTEQKYTLDEMAVLAAEKVGGGHSDYVVIAESITNISVAPGVEVKDIA